MTLSPFLRVSDVDWSFDPCTRAEVLRKIYYALLSGQAAVETEYTANGVQRRVRYVQADLAKVETEWRAAEHECAGTTGRRISTIRLATSKGV